jgi:hypothetical protein
MKGFGLAIAAAIILLGMFGAAWLCWGPGAMQRRKRGRQELWLNAHADFIHRKELDSRQKAHRPPVDREALEREVRRWD